MKCIECKTEEVKIKKHGMCLKCYGISYRKGLISDSGKLRRSSRDHDRELTDIAHGQMYHRELLFVKNFFNHPNWIPQPAIFTFTSGKRYRPDFYDIERGVFIEVVGSRQAYHEGKWKYEEFRKTYSFLKLEVRAYTGEIYKNGDSA